MISWPGKAVGGIILGERYAAGNKAAGSAGQAGGSRGDGVEVHRQADGGVIAHQHDHVGDAVVAEAVHGPVVERLRNQAGAGERGGDLIDQLLAFVGEAGGMAGDDGGDGRIGQADLLAALFMRGGGIGGMPPAVDDESPGVKCSPSGLAAWASLGLWTQTL